MPENTYSIKKSDAAAFIFTVISLFVAARLLITGGFNFGFTLGLSSILITGTVYLFSKECKDKGFCCFILASISALSAGYSLTNDYLMKFLSFVFILFLFTILFTLLSSNTDGPCGDYRLITGSIRKSFRAVFDNFALPFKSIKAHTADKKSSGIFQLLVGLGISVPLACIILPLLATSDIAFDSLVSKLLTNLTTFIFTLVLTLIATPIIYAHLFSLKKKAVKTTGTSDISGKIPTVTVNTVLCIVSVIYIAYLISQLAYISKAFAFLLPENYTAAEFARSGFFQMAVICCINFVILFIFSVFTNKSESKSPLFTKLLLMFICIFSLFYISTAFIKMIKYISLFGLTRLRVLTSIFMLMLALIFVIIFLKLIFKKIKYIKPIIVICAITMIAVSVIDINTVIANYNYSQYKQGKIKPDVEQLYTLGISALPTLVELSEERDFEDIDNVYSTIYELSSEIYVEGLYDLSLCTERESVKTSVFEKNLVWIRAEKALKKFAENNPEFDYYDYFSSEFEDLDAQ